MKLPQLLSLFLYQNKTLALPGIGVFTLDPSATNSNDEASDQPRVIQGVSFQQTNVLKADEKLIGFIHEYTGKMKPLAESDLDSYLRLGIQLLNIGKPFYFDGIGSILKNKDGIIEFTPGEVSSVKLILPGEEKAETADKKKKILDEEEKQYAPQTKTAKSLLLTIGIAGGIAIIAWAGYNLYKKKTVPIKNTPDSEVVLKDDIENVQQVDTSKASNTFIDSAALKKKDSIVNAQPILKKSDSAMYKFVILSTANKNRALRRYNQLIGFNLKVKMDTKDSTYFKIYFPVYTLPKDTLRIKDSLDDYYATKTIIEQ